MLITASAVQFAKLSGHEAPNEEEFSFRSSPNTREIMAGSRWMKRELAARKALASTQAPSSKVLQIERWRI